MGVPAGIADRRVTNANIIWDAAQQAPGPRRPKVDESEWNALRNMPVGDLAGLHL